jgi:microcystin degradation protein MlrC
MPQKLAFIELHQETNSFSSLTTSMREFHGFSLTYGEDVWKFADKFKAQAFGFREAVQKWGNGEFEILPVYAAWAWSGGPIETEVFQHFLDTAVEAVKNAADLAGIYFSMHGAMGVVGVRDPETVLLRAMRAAVGTDFPIAVSFDLHANVTRENAELASFIVGYHTNPHRDFRRVGRKAGQVLMQMVRGEVKPVTAFRKLPILKGGGWGIDFLQPMRGIIRRLKQMEKMPKVLIAATYWVHIWMDDEELGWSVMVTTNDDQALAEKLVDELAERCWAVRDRKHPIPKSVEEAILIARRSKIRRMLGAVTFCDVSDTVGAGAPGANTNILAALVAKAPSLRSYVPVRDPVAAEAAWEAGLGATLHLRIGGCIDPEHNPCVELEVKAIFKAETQWGKTSVLQHRGIHIILTELPFPAYFASDFTGLGLNLWKADIIVVKNLFPFRYRLAKYNRRTVNVITSGITNIDVFQLNYVDCPRPIYPLDDVQDWRLPGKQAIEA